MPTLIAWRLAAILLIMAGSLVFPQSDTYMPGVVAQGEGKSEKNNEDKKNEGGEHKGEDKKNDKDNDRAPVKGKDGDVVPAAAYAVDVQCEFDVGAGNTTCSFTGIAPPDAKEVGHIDLPQEEVCAQVIGGDFEYVDPDPNTRVTGYKSRGSEGAFTLVLEGEVTTAGTATYWFKTGDGVFPATGPGLSCGEPTAEFVLNATQEPAAEPTPEIGTSGSLLVNIYTCSGVPEETTGFDWFGQCNPEGGVHEFVLSAVGEATLEPLRGSSDASGDIAFDSLEPGLYSLQMLDAKWCRAVSDSVTAEGHVAIEADERTTVWGFICQDGGSGS
jgi:hypothetical protein